MISLFALAVFAALANAGRPWTPHPEGRPGYGEDQLTVSTTSGHIHGKIDPAYPNVRQFLGIPFAKPPTGELRWSAPEPLSQPDARIEATQLPPSCFQYLSTRPGFYTTEIFQFNLQGLNRTSTALSEDCLTASIWTPASQSKNETSSLPVMIFLYGGHFLTGGQNVPYQIPTQWVNRSPNHIVISFNYRTNIFGFPGSPALPSQNLGLLDQRAAVQWIQQNIASFGGDPEQMVLFGQSAGAASVDYYNYAYHQDPIVKGLIMESGTAFIPIGGDPTGMNFTFVATQLGYTGSPNSSTNILAYMRSLPASRIEAFIASYADAGTSPTLLFEPIPDNTSVFQNYTSRALSNLTSPIPAIIGTNLQDGVPFAPFNPHGPNTTLVHQAYLSNFFCPATETIRLRQQTGRLTYSYRYSGNFSNISPQSWMGAYHCSELPMLFGTFGNFRGQPTEWERKTSRAMQDAWVAFAKNPVEGLRDSQAWSSYDYLGQRVVRAFGGQESGGDVVVARNVGLGSVEAMCAGAVCWGCAEGGFVRKSIMGILL